MSSVARVDHGNYTALRRRKCRAFERVTHCDYVRIRAYRAYGVHNALAFCGGAVGRGRKPESGTAEFEHCGFETQSRSGGRLEEQRGKFLAFAGVSVLFPIRHNVFGCRDYAVYLFRRKVGNVYQMSDFFHILRLIVRFCRIICRFAQIKARKQAKFEFPFSVYY